MENKRNVSEEIMQAQKERDEYLLQLQQIDDTSIGKACVAYLYLSVRRYNKWVNSVLS